MHLQQTFEGCLAAEKRYENRARDPKPPSQRVDGYAQQCAFHGCSEGDPVGEPNTSFELDSFMAQSFINNQLAPLDLLLQAQRNFFWLHLTILLQIPTAGGMEEVSDDKRRRAESSSREERRSARNHRCGELSSERRWMTGFTVVIAQQPQTH